MLSVQFLITILFVFYFNNKCNTEKFKYKVIAPEFICDNNQDSSHTIIRLIGEDVPKLNFNLTVTFQLIKTNEMLKQRQVLLMWRKIRKLNKKLKKLPQEQLKQGVILINNEMLTPGVLYVFHLTAQNENLTKIEKRQFNLNYLDQNDNLESFYSVHLIGSEITYANLQYTAQIHISTCSNNYNNYEFLWQIFGESRRILYQERTKSRILQLTPGTMSSGKMYTITCSILDGKSNRNRNRNNPTLRVNVLEREMQLTAYTTYMKIGLNQSIHLNTLFHDPDHAKGHLIFQWTCKSLQEEKNCPEFESENNTKLYLPNGFTKTGIYVFTIEARKRNATVRTTSRIEVVEQMLPVIQVENALFFYNPFDSIKISTNIQQIEVGCSLKWISIRNRTEYKYIDLKQVPGYGKILKITDEDEFEENNDTFVSKQYDLILPAPNHDTWKGLECNAKYLFRLIATCPCMEDNSTQISSAVDVIVTTNSLPLVNPLQIWPESGIALRTEFNFHTKPPINCNNNPLLYKFGYIHNRNHKIINLITQYDSSSAVTILPYLGEPIETVLEICDSNNNACNSTMGPKVSVQLPIDLNTIEINNFLNTINKSINERDYFTAFTLTNLLLETTKNLHLNSQYEMIEIMIKNRTKQEIETFLNSNDKTWIKPTNNLLKHIKLLDDEIPFPEDLINDLLLLRDKLMALKRKKRETNEKKLERIVNDMNMIEIKEYLEISELAIKRLNDFERVEKEIQKLFEKIDNYVPRICQYIYGNYKTDIRIELSTLIFVVEPIYLTRQYNSFIFIPYSDIKETARMQMGREIAMLYRNERNVCVSKILFIDDNYFHIPQYVYHAKLFSITLDQYLDVNLANFGITIQMPVKAQPSANQMLQCVLWNDPNWDFTKCKTYEQTTEMIRCGCKSLGYFSIIPVERTTLMSTTSTIIIIQTSSTFELGTVSMTQDNNIVSEVTNSLETNNNDTSNERLLSNESKMSTASIWSISLLSTGIFVILLMSLIAYRKFKRSQTVQNNSEPIQYAFYIDEHILN